MARLSAASLVAIVPVLAVSAAVTLHEQVSVPSAWTYTSVPPSSQALTLQVALPLTGLDGLEAKLNAVSTPGSSEYGQHLDKDAADALFAPSAACEAAVTGWLKSSGVTDTQSDGQLVTFATTIGNANSMLGANFKTYSNAAGVSKIRTTSYSLPKDLVSCVDFVAPTTYFGTTTSSLALPEAPAKELTKRSIIPSQCKQNFTYENFTLSGFGPECLKILYSVGGYTPDATSGSTVAFGSFLNQSAGYADLLQYEQIFGIPEQNFTVTLINGGVNEQPPTAADDGEANLDVQNIVGVSHPLPVTEFITGGSPPFIPNLDEPTAADNENEPYLPYYQYLLSQSNEDLPKVISNSYGDDEQTVPYYYARRVCNLIGIMGIRGISVLESSGDTGVGAACRANDGSNATQFTPIFPATCPYITAVGGLQFGLANDTQTEVAWTGSSGGFSNYFPTAFYQRESVANYFARHVSAETKAYYAPYFNRRGRGFPDVSAHSYYPGYYEIVYNGVLSPSGGTSAAAPVFAAIVALLNDARLRAGKPQLGFLNPLLYTVGQKGLNDIYEGQSDGCTGINLQSGQPVPGGGVIPGSHWNATVGWDPVTGLGSPNFAALEKIVLSH